MNSSVYIGVDPGESGGISSIYEGQHGTTIVSTRIPETERDVLTLLTRLSKLADQDIGGLTKKGNVFAMIEQQVPRPTRFFDKAMNKWRESILKSTCILYGNYRMLRSFLVAASIPFEAITSVAWQRGLVIRPRAGNEEKGAWKNRLKSRAQELFPEVKVTLANADSLLIAEHCRRTVARRTASKEQTNQEEQEILQEEQE